MIKSRTGTVLALALLLGGCSLGDGRDASPAPYVTPSALLPEPPSPPPSSSPRPASLRSQGSPPAEGKGSRDPRDVNGDGFADLTFVMSHGPWSPDLVIVYGSKDGLDPRTRTVVPGAHLEFTGPADTADLDGDGFADVLVHGHVVQAGADSDVPHILWGGPKGVDPEAVPTAVPTSAAPPFFSHETVPGDFDGDGEADLALKTPMTNGTGERQESLAVLYGPFTRKGVPRRHTVQPSPVSVDIQGLIAGRIDGRRATDLLVRDGSDGGQAASWLVRGGPGGLSRRSRELNKGNSLAFGDFDGDGRGDVVVADSGSRNNEPGYETEPPGVDGVMTVYFGGARRAPQVFKNLRFARETVAGDYDGDGTDDLAIDRGPDGVELLHGGRNGLRRGGKVIRRSGPATDPNGGRLRPLERLAHPRAAADYDGDGRDELLLTWSPTGHVPEWGSALSLWWATDGDRDESTFGTGGW
ncbi:FG-GAP repeat domain-containing protein [Streptosporangium sp. NBC_01469]|uniref:FG-GAP repeat domain-containing protein n=1 Tax=Streptosporangium sp. NBC_01469 TaxID=2903898 RepID=UPI002E2A270C|nr:VCBS repeat-containing protein [Streptosporangium sp. NBC_01469]